MVELQASASTPFASDFTTSTTAIKIEDYTYYYYSTSASNRASQGYELEGTDLGDIKAKFSVGDQTLMNYPMTMTAYVNDSFSGNVSFVYNTIPQNPAMIGKSHTIYDGIGTLIQPDGSYLTNVSRFHIQDTAVVTVPILGTSQLIRSKYEYYDLNSTNHMRVFLHLSAKVISGFPEPLFEETVLLSSVSGSPVASLNVNNALNYKVFPNPAKITITIQNISESTKVQLIDVCGRSVEFQSIGGFQYNIYGFSAGMYTLRFETPNQELQNRIIMIK